MAVSRALQSTFSKRMKLAALPLLVFATPAFASGDVAAAAGLAVFVSFGVGIAGGAAAGWFGWRSKPVWIAEIFAVPVLCALILMAVRPQDFRSGYVEWFFVTVLASLLPLAMCHYPACAIARGLSSRKNRDSKDPNAASGDAPR